jgi:hypothetical protein
MTAAVLPCCRTRAYCDRFGALFGSWETCPSSTAAARRAAGKLRLAPAAEMARWHAFR